MSMLQNEYQVFTCRHRFPKPRTGPGRFTVWSGLAGPDLGSSVRREVAHPAARPAEVSGALLVIVRVSKIGKFKISKIF